MSFSDFHFWLEILAGYWDNLLLLAIALGVN
jgi:hypothetical protein